MHCGRTTRHRGWRPWHGPAPPSAHCAIGTSNLHDDSSPAPAPKAARKASSSSPSSCRSTIQARSAASQPAKERRDAGCARSRSRGAGEPGPKAGCGVRRLRRGPLTQVSDRDHAIDQSGVRCIVGRDGRRRLDFRAFLCGRYMVVLSILGGSRPPGDGPACSRNPAGIGSGRTLCKRRRGRSAQTRKAARMNVRESLMRPTGVGQDIGPAAIGIERTRRPEP